MNTVAEPLTAEHLAAVVHEQQERVRQAKLARSHARLSSKPRQVLAQSIHAVMAPDVQQVGFRKPALAVMDETQTQLTERDPPPFAVPGSPGSSTRSPTPI